MKARLQRVVGVVAVAAVLAAVASLWSVPGARAETWNLELKRLEAGPLGRSLSPLEMYVLRQTSSQSFFYQMGLPGGVAPAGDQAADFSKVIKKEPTKYNSPYPFRGVAKLGTQQFGFVLDAAASQEAPAEAKDQPPKDQAETAPEAKAKPAVATDLEGYSRLYFDLNHNGDLTDDKVIEAEQSPRGIRFSVGYAQYTFPRVDVSLEGDGAKIDYAFFLSVYSRRTDKLQYAVASLSAAAYREGEITLEGKKRRIVLVDFNSNGRFDDQMEIDKDIKLAGGEVYHRQGDMLYVDPDPNKAAYNYGYDTTRNDEQYPLSKLINLDGRFYDLEISVSGEKLSLKPSAVPVGSVTNPNDGYRALVYGDLGFVKISGGKSKPAPLPEGEWKLLSYTIDRTGLPEEAAEPAKKKEFSLLQSLTEAIAGAAGPSGPRVTLVSARATADFPAVKVREGQTVALPFGPPYKPTVNVAYRSGAEEFSLGMSLVGSAGEICSDLMVDGGRPKAPEFTISTTDGKEVQRGTFEYG
jgi:hypothetical protein